MNERKKRYASAERSAANEEQLVPGCEDANERMAQFGISIVFPPALDKDIEDLKKCMFLFSIFKWDLKWFESGDAMAFVKNKRQIIAMFDILGIGSRITGIGFR